MKELIEKWRLRHEEYLRLANEHVDNEHNYKKFTYKAMATRDCFKELAKLTESENTELTAMDYESFNDFRLGNPKVLDADFCKDGFIFHLEKDSKVAVKFLEKFNNVRVQFSPIK